MKDLHAIYVGSQKHMANEMQTIIRTCHGKLECEVSVSRFKPFTGFAGCNFGPQGEQIPAMRRMAQVGVHA